MSSSFHTSPASNPSDPEASLLGMPQLSNSSLETPATHSAQDYAHIRRLADVQWASGDREIFYLGSQRFEFLSATHVSLADQPLTIRQRDFKSELRELRDQIEDCRHQILYGYPIAFLDAQIARAKYPGEKFRLNRIKEGFSTESLSFDARVSCQMSCFFYQSIEEKAALVKGLGQDQRFKELIERERALIQIFDKVFEFTCSSPDVLDKIVVDRAVLALRAREFAQEIEPQTVHVYLDDEGFGSGVVGRAKMIARSLHELAPQLTIKIFAKIEARGTDFFHPVTVDQGIEIIPYTDSNQLADKIRGSGVHMVSCVSPRLFSEAQERGELVIPLTARSGLRIGSAPKEFIDDVVEMNSDYFSRPFSGYLQDPFAVLPFDSRLQRVASEARQMPLEDLFSRRHEWLERNGREFVAPLEAHANCHNWQVDKAVWTLSYIVELNNFLAEMVNLRDALNDSRWQEQDIFIERGEQIVIFAAQSRYLKGSFSPKDFTDLGMTVVLESGEVINPDKKTSTIPVTLVWSNGFPNPEIREFVSELSGSSSYGRDGLRIGFPLYLTGHASWYEAVSAGQVALHDNFDIASGLMKPALEQLARRSGSIDDFSSPEISPQTESPSQRLLMGVPGRGEDYLNLRFWSASARKFSERISLFNCAYDIVNAMRDRQIRT